jgi:hypothetical protein
VIERRRDHFPGVSKRTVTAIAIVVSIVVCTVERYLPLPVHAAPTKQCT